AHVAVDGLLDLVIDQRFDPGTDPLRVQGDHRDHEHREDQAGDDHRSHADPEDAGHTEGAGGGRDEVVGDHHAAGQCDAEGGVAVLLDPGDGPCQRVHDHVARVAEDRDRDQGPDAGHRPGFTVLTEQTQERHRDGLGGTGDFEDLPYGYA